MATSLFNKRAGLQIETIRKLSARVPPIHTRAEDRPRAFPFAVLVLCNDAAKDDQDMIQTLRLPGSGH
jgi:hypothetical protein